MKKFLARLRAGIPIEYALMASLLAIVAFTSLQLMGDDPTSRLYHAPSAAQR